MSQAFLRCMVLAAMVVLPFAAAIAQVGSDNPSVISAAAIDLSTCERPKYPEASLAANEAGTTVLRYVVDTDRSLRDVRVERSSGWPRLDQAAVEAIGRCKGIPALVNGVPVSSYGRFNANWRPSAKAALQIDADARCKPAYPTEALQLELQGTTKLRFALTDKGALTKVEVVQSSGSSLLDAAAVAGLATCKFTPAQDANGVAVPGSFDVEYVWKLQ